MEQSTDRLEEHPQQVAAPKRRVRKLPSRAALASLVMVLTLGSGGGLAAAANGMLPWAERPVGCVKPDRTMDLYAVELPRQKGQIRLGYGLTPETANYPGPTIEMMEGECLAITLHNQIPEETLVALRTTPDHPLGVSLHVHGVKYTQDSDGTVHSNSFVASGESRTYTWYAKARDKKTGSLGTAGYWWYHDHVGGGEHGTQGVGAGLFGAMVVRRKGDPKPDRTFVTAFGDRQTINLRNSEEADDCDWDNPQPGPACFVARLGERIEFINFGIGNEMHTWHLHGHNWANTRTGLLDNGPMVDEIPLIDNRPLGPGDSFGFQVTAGDSVGPGHWMLHCHMQFHSDLGMSTMLHILDENGKMPPMSQQHVLTNSGVVR